MMESAFIMQMAKTSAKLNDLSEANYHISLYVPILQQVEQLLHSQC